MALVDADGTWLAIAVVPASVQDRDTLSALDAGQVAWPSLREAVLDGAFAAECCRAWCNRHSMLHRVGGHDRDQTGFVMRERCWVVEHCFGWLTHWSRLLRDRAGRLEVAAARLAFVAVPCGIEALLNPMPIHTVTS